MDEKSKITILFINPFLFEQKLGGMDSLLLDLLRKMDTKRFKRIVVLPRPGGISSQYEAVADQIIYLDTAPITKVKSLFSLVMTLLQIPVVAYRLVKIIQETGAQILHTQTELVFGSGLAARWTNVRSIYMVQNTPLKASEKWVWDIIVRLLDKMADRILVCSNDVRTEFLERGVSSQKLTIIYNGIDTDYFSPAGIDTRERIRAEFLRGSEQYIVGMMGRLHVSKGIETFLHAAALIRKERRDVRFLIVGTIAHAKHASYEQGLRNLATQLGLADCVTFAGFRDDVPQALSSFDVFLFPSLREPFGLALAEAMSVECSVVASDSGGVPEFVTSSLIGCLIPPNNPAGFAQATLMLLADPSERKRMGQAARRHIEMNFSIDKQVQATERVYEEVVNS